MPDIDSRNHFYLGREHDLATGETAPEPLLYKSKDLTTHAVCVGMTGSGKTGLCLSLLEEAALDGIPAICIDPKGDLGNLMLGFEDFDPKRFAEYADESVAQRKGLTVDEYAAQTAELWKSGLASWNQGPERIEKYNESVERLIFTPGASHGLPMTVLKSFDAPPAVLINDTDAFRERVQSAVSGLLALLGIDADPVRSREHIFLSNVLKTSWERGKDLSIADMIREIQSPPFKSVGVMDLETFYPEKERTKLAMDLNNLLASPSFAGWMTGQPLNVQELFFSKEGKPRHSIISIGHLDDSQRMFFVTILLNEVLAWMRTQPGTGSLRALVYMDEVFGYFPPTANPPSKLPMLTLLKQARAFGLGCMLATQNPVDLDYKGLSNAGTWFLGRLQTERDKMRVMEGLEGASAAAGSTFDKQAMERTLAGVGSRVFLMNSVHEDKPRVFHTRWAMSYLCGPLSRQQTKKLMDPLRDRFVPPVPEKAELPEVEEEPQKGESTESKSSDQKPEPAPDALTPAQVKKLASAKAKLSASQAELFKSIALLPIAASIGLLPAAFDLVLAMARKAATKRRTNTLVSAFWDSFDKPMKAFQQWREAKNTHDEVAEQATSSLVLPWSAWLAIGIAAAQVIALICLIMFAIAKLAPAATPAPSTPSQPADAESPSEPKSLSEKTPM